MDVATIAQTAAATFAPFLPRLLKFGDKAAEAAAKKIGGDTWEYTKSLWAKIWPKLEASPAAKEAISDAASMPDDEDALAALRLQIRKLLTQDQGLAREIAGLIEERQQAGVSVIVSGERAVGIGGDMSGGTINTGDSPKPQQ
jgi:hypothetical protein